MIPFFAFLLSMANVKAAETCKTSPSMSTIISGTPTHPGEIYYFRVNGLIGFCLDEGKKMSSSAKISPKGTIPSGSTVIKALNFCNQEDCNANLNYIIAQLYVWGKSNADMFAAYCTFNNGASDDQCATSAATQAQVNVILSKINAASSEGSVIYWDKSDGASGFQRIATKQSPSCKITCPENTQNAGKSIQECIQSGKTEKQCIASECGDETNGCKGYKIDKTGAMATCSVENYSTTSAFAETVSSVGSGSEYSGSINGTREAIIGTYGALYCMETRAQMNLPGSIANPITKGSSIVWPTYDSLSQDGIPLSKFGNMYPMSFSGTMTCHIQVAPNLTYEDKCASNPLKDFGDYVKKMYDQYNTTDEIPDDPTEVHYAKDSYVTGTAAKSTNKTKTREELRHDLSPLVKGSCTTETKSGCMDTQYFDKWIEWATKNLEWYTAKLTEATTNYNNKKRSCSTAHGGDSWTDTVSNTTKTCDSDDSDTKSAKAKMDNFQSIVTTWTNYKDAWDTSKTNFNTYATNYANAVKVYKEVKDVYEYEIKCSGSSCDVYNFLTSATVKYENEGSDYAEGFNLGISLSAVDSVTYSCTGCTGRSGDMYETSVLYGWKVEDFFQNLMGSKTKPTDTTIVDNFNGHSWSTWVSSYLKAKIATLEGTEITINTNEIRYKLPSGYYTYLNKDSGLYTMAKPGGNYLKFDFSSLPTSFNNKVNKEYKLVLTSLALGNNAQFNSNSNGGGQTSDYVCYYKVASGNDDCLCPTGTKNADTDLYQALLDSNGTLTCADAKEKYCNGDNIPDCTVNCNEEKYCTSDKSIKITSCVNSGNSRSTCENKLCGNGTYTCSSGQLKGMDMTSCVQARIAEGSNAKTAETYCNKTYCKLGTIAVYRTIDLKNPFPSKDADDNGNTAGLSRGWFNTDVAGRYPGSNWNGQNIVKTKIFKNRGVSDYEVYNQTPLYHIELDTTTILKIREYNKKQQQYDDGYADFTLTCVQDGDNYLLGTSCLSSFIHSGNYGFDRGNKSKCGGAGTTTSLGKCLYGTSS
jgi:hypothetical protein